MPKRIKYGICSVQFGLKHHLVEHFRKFHPNIAPFEKPPEWQSKLTFGTPITSQEDVENVFL